MVFFFLDSFGKVNLFLWGFIRYYKNGLLRNGRF